MRQLVLTEPNAVSWADVPEPDLQGPCEALVRPLVYAAGAAMYTTGVRLHTGRAMARFLIPEALALVASGRLRPELVTSRVAAWDDAPEAVLREETKLVLSR